MKIPVYDLSYEQQRSIHNALAESTIGHIGKNQGLFEKLEFDSVANPSQDLRNVFLPSVTTSPEEVDDLAKLASPRLYPFLKEEFLVQGALMSILRKKRSENTAKGHVFPVNTHQLMPDIALVEVATSIVEHELFDTPWHDIVNSNGLIISRGVTTLQAFGLAASEVVQKVSSVFLSFPRTETMRKIINETKLPGNISFDDIVDYNNNRMKSELMTWLPAGYANLTEIMTIHPEARKRTFVAWSGTTDNVIGEDPYNPEQISIEQANYGILEPLKHGVILPMVTWDRGPDRDPILITGEIRNVRNKTDVDEVQEWQRLRLAKALGLDDDKVTIRKIAV